MNNCQQTALAGTYRKLGSVVGHRTTRKFQLSVSNATPLTCAQSMSSAKKKRFALKGNRHQNYSKRDQHASASLCFTSTNDREGQSAIEWRKLKERGMRGRVTFFFPSCALVSRPKFEYCPMQSRNLYICQHCGVFGLAAWPAKASGDLFLGCTS